MMKRLIVYLNGVRVGLLSDAEEPVFAYSSACSGICFAITFLPTESFRPRSAAVLIACLRLSAQTVSQP